MSKELTLRIITPERVVLDTTAESVRVPAIDGSMGIFPRHAGMVAALDAGVLSYKEGGREERLFISGGFAEVRSNTVRVLTSAGEAPSEIDLERAKVAEARARERLKPRRSGLTAEEATIDIARAQASLQRAIQRLKVHGYAD
jgi:F-type H+-transporting ATPase subunit epsilon